MRRGRGWFHKIAGVVALSAAVTLSAPAVASAAAPAWTTPACATAHTPLCVAHGDHTVRAFDWWW